MDGQKIMCVVCVCVCELDGDNVDQWMTEQWMDRTLRERFRL